MRSQPYPERAPMIKSPNPESTGSAGCDSWPCDLWGWLWWMGKVKCRAGRAFQALPVSHCSISGKCWSSLFLPFPGAASSTSPAQIPELLDCSSEQPLPAAPQGEWLSNARGWSPGILICVSESPSSFQLPAALTWNSQAHIVPNPCAELPDRIPTDCGHCFCQENAGVLCCHHSSGDTGGGLKCFSLGLQCELKNF